MIETLRTAALLTALACAGLCAPGLARQPAPLVDLARYYQRVEFAYAAALPVDPATRLAVGREMDDATRAFFRGAQAARTHLDRALLLLLAGDDASALITFMIGLDATIDIEEDGARFHIRLSHGRDVDAAAYAPDLRVEVTGGDGRAAASFAVTSSADRALTAGPGDLSAVAEGRYNLDVVAACGRRMTAGTWMHLHTPLNAVRDDVLRRVEAMRFAAGGEHPSPHSLQILLDRAGELHDPPARNVTQWALDLARLRDEVLHEVSQLEKDIDPYARLSGDLWMRIPAGQSAIPCRLIVPPVADDSPRRPLLVALHGAGGNEHLFPDGHGAGILRQLALREGFVVVSPSTMMMGQQSALPDLIEFLRDSAHIDPDRVSIVGHSMGAMMALQLAGEYPSHVHRVAAIAGGRIIPESARHIPVRMVGAEFDALIPEARVRHAAETSKEQGAQVTYHMVPNADHLLVVADVLRDALRFVLEDE